VKGIKSTFDEHWVIYGTANSLYCTPD